MFKVLGEDLLVQLELLPVFIDHLRGGNALLGEDVLAGVHKTLQSVDGIPSFLRQFIFGLLLLTK